MGSDELSPSQLHSIEVTERVCSVFSLLGTSFIIATFLSSKAFHKPINRLVFYAAIGNVLANVGTLISRSGILMGGAVCQFQGFLIQMFLPADALWTLAMACNVYLTFFRKYDAKQLRALEWKYMIFCYGLPFIPAFVYFFIKTESRGKVYGNAVLWCWIGLPWDYLRIAAFYGPVWLIILITFAIYITAGKEIFQKRRQLKEFSNEYNEPYPLINNPFESRKTTEVHITRELAHVPSDDSSETSLRRGPEPPAKSGRNYDPYSITIETGQEAKTGHGRQSSIVTVKETRTDRVRGQHTATNEANRAAFSYARCALLFFASLLVTWVPSTINRVNSLAHPERVSFPLEYVSCLVLPLQGFWNAAIYICTSIPACKMVWEDLTLFVSHPFSRSQQPNSLTERRRSRNTMKPRTFSSRSIGGESLGSMGSESMKGFVRV